MHKVNQSKRKRRTCQPHVTFSWYVNVDILAVIAFLLSTRVGVTFSGR